MGMKGLHGGAIHSLQLVILMTFNWAEANPLKTTVVSSLVPVSGIDIVVAVGTLG